MSTARLVRSWPRAAIARGLKMPMHSTASDQRQVANPSVTSFTSATAQTRSEEGENPSRAAIETRLLMAIAAVLVANSHLEAFYPRPWLAGDGLLGNSVFFFLAGFGLMRSELRRSHSFLSWYWRRIVRIYPSVLLVMVIFGICINAEWRTWQSVADPLAQLIWPTRYTFVAMIFPFYFLYFPIVRVRRVAAFLVIAVVLCFIYLAAYLPDATSIGSTARLQLSSRPYFVHTSAYFQIMVFGGWAARAYRPTKIRLLWRAIATAGVFASYVILKYFMVTGHFARAYCVLHASVAILCVLMFDLFCSEELIAALRLFPSVWRAVSFVGGLTLEIYIVHLFVAEYHWVRSAAFPVNLVWFWSLTIPLAYIVGSASHLIRRQLQREMSHPKPIPDALSVVATMH